MDIVSRLSEHIAAAEHGHRAPENHLSDATVGEVRIARDEITRLRSLTAEMERAIQGVLDDDDASTSLADQRARWTSRMDALRSALSRSQEGK